MAKRRPTILDLLDKHSETAAGAFVDSLRAMKDSVQIGLLEAAIGRQDTAAVLQILNLKPGYFAAFDMALREAYTAGGVWATQEMQRTARRQGVRIVGQFDNMNERAQNYVATRSSTLVSEVLHQNDTGLRDAIRVVLNDAFMQRRPPRTVALDLVGRINRATGRREGGIVGLLPREIQYRDTALSELRSGNPERLRNYLRRKTRNKRYDNIVKRAIADKKPIPVKQARGIIQHMENNLLRVRGERIARTELLGSLHEAQDEATRQLIDDGSLRAENVVNIWDAAEDSATRNSHSEMDGDKRPFGEYFTSGLGNQMRYPGDRSRGATAADVINCRCRLDRQIDFLAQELG